MSKLSHASSRRMYSWWWDSHVSPQNSRWLVENLSDMDGKVKSMLKLIEQDADSFARKAEMYYEKKPELVKMVEEFYRAYRALAERYDHANGALHQAHQTMTEAFPNEVPSPLIEDELEYYNDNEIKKGLEKFKDGGKVRNRDFVEAEKKGENKNEILPLREALAKYEAEKESRLAQYKHSLEKLSHQKLEVDNIEEGSKGLAERANKAEFEVESLRKALKALELENEKSHVQYQKCLENIKNMEGIISSTKKDIFDLNDRALKAETEAQTLKLEFAILESKKVTSLNQCQQFSDTILNLENNLVISEDEAKKLKERAEEAETEAETLKRALTELGVEKENTAVLYQKCLETVSSLERELSRAQEEVEMLHGEIESAVIKLKSAEEQCLHSERSNLIINSELENTKLEMGSQIEELTEKKREMGILWTIVQEERVRFSEAEAALEEQLKSLNLEIQNRSQLVSDIEARSQKIKEENVSLKELNLASSASIKDLQSEIFSLNDAKGKLEEEVELRTDQINALQQEICYLKEELNDLNEKYHTIMDKNLILKDENLNLKETRDREISEKEDLLKILENFENIVEKNEDLEKSLSDLNADYEGAREEIMAMVKSFQSLFVEKSNIDSENASLVTQVHVANEKLEKISEKNYLLENSVTDAYGEIEKLKMGLKSLEGSCQLLENEKNNLINEKVKLISEVEITEQKVEEIEKNHRELDEKHSVLEKEKDSMINEVEQLRLIVKESKLKENKQIIEIENLRGTVFDMQKRSINLQEENLKLIDEKISLVKDFLDLQDENNIHETASLDNFSLIFKNIIHEKDMELDGAIKNLEEETNAKDQKIELLNEKISKLEGDNEEIGAQLAAYVPAISSLRECISSLENFSCFSTQVRTNDDEKLKDTIESHIESQEDSTVNQKETDKITEMKELETIVKSVEKIVIENNSKLEAATRQRDDNIKQQSVNLESQNGDSTKDVTLYQISNFNRVEKITTQTKKGVHFDLNGEKKLGVDKVTTTNRLTLPTQELDKTKTMEKLNSDSEKLTDLRCTVQDLKRKMEKSEKGRESKNSSEFGSVKGKLEKAEENIIQLSDLNNKLKKSVDDSDDVKDVLESEENRNSRKKFSEQAQKVSERVRQLEFEVQKIQYIMLKLDSEEKIETKSEIMETKRKTSVRDYLGLRANKGKKKRAFCGFVNPPTIED